MKHTAFKTGIMTTIVLLAIGANAEATVDAPDFAENTESTGCNNITFVGQFICPFECTSDERAYAIFTGVGSVSAVCGASAAECGEVNTISIGCGVIDPQPAGTNAMGLCIMAGAGFGSCGAS